MPVYHNLKSSTLPSSLPAQASRLDTAHRFATAQRPARMPTGHFSTSGWDTNFN